MYNLLYIIRLRVIIIIFTAGFSVQPGVLYSQDIDLEILDRINNSDSVSVTYKTMTVFTNSVTPVSAALPLGLFIKGLAEKDKELQWRALNWAITFAGNTLITGIVKYSVNRERPFEDHSIIIQKTEVHSPSFPSGHSSSAFVIATTLTLYYPEWYVVIPSFAWAGTVAYSRMYLGVHYPSDVIGGMAIGIGTAFLSKMINDKLQEKKKVPPEIITD